MDVARDLTIVIVSYGSRRDLERCLPSIYAQTYQPTAVIVVDNAPGDGTAEFLERDYPAVAVVSSGRNAGYAGGNNLGVRLSTTKWVLLLNPDTVLHEDALRRMMEVAHEFPDALVTAKLLNIDGSINACGLEMHLTGITSCRAYRQRAESVSGTLSVPAASGAALLVQKRVFVDLGGFDDGYFMYMEDVDLSLRARARGHRILCAGDAAITHDYELGMRAEKFELLERNRLVTLLKVLDGRTLVRLSFALVATELATWSFAVVRGPPFMKAKSRSYRGVAASRRRWRASRRTHAARRTVPDEVLLRDATPSLPFDQLVESTRLRRILSCVTAPFYRLARNSLGIDT